VQVEEVRRATLALLDSDDERDVAYIDRALLDQYARDARDVADDDEALTPPPGAPEVQPDVRVYYGNHLAAAAHGVLYFSNGSPNHPNDPCGRRFRRRVQMTPGSRIDPFRACGSFEGYRITVS
jgi:hypothetical protein